VSVVIGLYVSLRWLEGADRYTLLRWMSDPAVRQFIPPFSLPTRDFVDALLAPRAVRNNNCVFGVIDRRAGTLIGITGLLAIDPATGCAFTGTIMGERQHWGKGCALEAKILALRYGFDRMHIRSAFARVDPSNLRAMALVNRCGYASVPEDSRDVPIEQVLILTDEAWRETWGKYVKMVNPAFWIENPEFRQEGDKGE
jgi:RimJ/RimL family protein N-acetyltransferase